MGWGDRASGCPLALRDLGSRGRSTRSFRDAGQGVSTSPPAGSPPRINTRRASAGAQGCRSARMVASQTRVNFSEGRRHLPCQVLNEGGQGPTHGEDREEQGCGSSILRSFSREINVLDLRISSRERPPHHKDDFQLFGGVVCPGPVCRFPCYLLFFRGPNT